MGHVCSQCILFFTLKDDLTRTCDYSTVFLQLFHCVLSDCPAYVEFLNTRSPDGEEFVGATTVDECIDACDDDEDCLGFDYNRNSEKCFAFYDSSYLDNVIENAAVIDQYRKTLNCGALSSVTPTDSAGINTVTPTPDGKD